MVPEMFLLAFASQDEEVMVIRMIINNGETHTT
jgi:hypothetical protein